jgi:hypothetical protein
MRIAWLFQRMARSSGIRHREERTDAAIQRSKGPYVPLDRFACARDDGHFAVQSTSPINLVCKIEGSERFVNWLVNRFRPHSRGSQRPQLARDVAAS